jgi:hypothetical protein
MADRRPGSVSSRLRVALFGAFCVLAVAATAGYVASKASAARQPDARVQANASPGTLDELLSRPHLLFVDAADMIHKRLADAALDDPRASHYVSDMTCDRVYFAAGRGLCSGADENYYGNRGVQDFDAHLRPGHRYAQATGLSSRARVSPDGRFGSVTLFVAGDSYGAPFSTRDHIFDLTSGRELGTLEDFTVYKDGAVFQSPDFNFWGTTFAADGNRFYATLGAGSVGATTYLVEGDLAKREMRVLRTNVECPSLSPDGTHIAFKKRIQNPSTWRIAVLDLATLQDTELAEIRSVDDQVEWLDDSHVLYSMSHNSQAAIGYTLDIWKASLNTNEPPQLFLENAFSPAVVR